ncbi:MAG: GUN4 domain-containing protein [Cyanophyceae cyanobacterium]
MTLSQCPVCNVDIPDDASLERCANCGWYLDSLSIPMTNAMAQFLASREEIQITWARDMWHKVQLQEELGAMGRDVSLMVRQLRRGHKERSQLFSQVLQLRELVKEQAAAINEAVSAEAKTEMDAAAASSAGEKNGGLSPSSEATLLAAVHTLQRQIQQQSALINSLSQGALVTPSSASLTGEVSAMEALAESNGAIALPDRTSPFDNGDLDLDRAAIATDTALALEDTHSSDGDRDETSVDSSKPGVSYRKLHKLLAAGKWIDADRETTRLMLKVAGRSSTSWLRIEDIENFPAADLQAIDRLWVAYSQDQFGFSVQKKLWLEVTDESTSQVEAWCQFGDRLGWLNKKKGSTGLNAPTGHLPSCSSVGVWWSSGLFPQVLEGCEL